MPYFPSLNDPNYISFGSMDRVPENVSFLAADANTNIPLSELKFKWHTHAQHIAIDNFQPQSYYEEYLMTATYSQKIQDLQSSQMERLTSLHASPTGPQSFLEVGCGDGSFMKYAHQKVSRVLGIEPSKKFAEEARCNGFEIINGYVGSETLLTNEKFDCFASRQVFEHLPDPVMVLTGIRKMLNPGAVGLIEVPNGHRALRMGRFFEFFPDHINYYSVNSLVSLASTAGLNVISCNESFDGDYLELWMRNEPSLENYFCDIVEHRENICRDLTEKVIKLTDAGQRLAIWGCGAKTLSILAACPSDLHHRVFCIIDSDPHKHGLYVPNTNIRVINPDQAINLQLKVILILALSYRDEIASTVRKKIRSCKSLFTLDDLGCIKQI
jgi:2-polyprenyl-3-methyl-5-hydroxy-6-metoxy-1,4-benzoquinol methylase